MNPNRQPFVERNNDSKKGRNRFIYSDRNTLEINSANTPTSSAKTRVIQKPKVFISYFKRNKKVANKISDFLAKHGCDPWTAENNLLPGQMRDSVIKKNIEQSNFFIACLSKEYVQGTGDIQKELKYAQKILEQLPEDKIFIIPVRLDNCKVPDSLSSRQWVDWHDLNARPKILNAIRTWGIIQNESH